MFLGGLAVLLSTVYVGLETLGPPLSPQPGADPVSSNSAAPAAAPEDLPELRSKGEIRIASRRGPGGVILSEAERELLEEFARSQGLAAAFTGLPTTRLLDALARGEVDLVAGARTVEVPEGVGFTLPWGVSGMQVVGRVGAGRIRNEDDLVIRQVAAKQSSPIWSRLARLASANPTMDLVVIPEHERIESMLDGVSSGRYDLLVTDSAQLEPYLPRHPDLQVALDLTAGEPRSWAVRTGATQLRAELNRFLNRRHLELEAARSYREDLAGLRERRVLRLVTVPGPVNYFVTRGRLKGFEYELVRRFAERHRMRVEVVTAGTVEEMQRLLLAGRGDLIAASLPAAAAGPDVAATRPYEFSAPVVIGRADGGPLVDAADLHGRRLLLPADSPYAGAVQALRDRGIAVVAERRPDVATADEALAEVAAGRADLTLIGSTLVRAEFTRHLELRAQFALTEPAPMAWLVRATDRQLLSALDEFIGETRQTGYYKALYTRYVERPAPAVDTAQLARADAISPYDDIVQEYAAHYDFDWRLIVAQMFQESHFDPGAESVAGASGLMQMLPATAASLGDVDLSDPRSNIRAGLRYMDYLRSQFEDDLNLQDRTWFTLAAYNAGLARVQRARARAAAMNLDPDRWFDNVEVAMLALGEASDSGCRCSQAAVYVREIRSRYNSYLHIARDTASGSSAPSI
jgi:membrane-bound lytic murein transglycosylase F